MRNRLITVFGGTGFIGRIWCARLAARGARMLVISRSPPRGGHLQPLGSVGQIVVERVDLSSEPALARGARRRGRRGQPDRHPARDPAAARSRRCRARCPAGSPGRGARRQACAMVQISAIGADPGSASAYARSKAEGERRVREALPERDDPAPEHRDRSRGRLLQPLRRDGRAAAGAAADRRRQDPVPAGLCRRRRARRSSPRCSATTAAGQTYELGGPQVYSFAELMRYMLQRGRPPPPAGAGARSAWRRCRRACSSCCRCRR